jgi:two-component system CheB/CheR fusion protein
MPESPLHQAKIAKQGSAAPSTQTLGGRPAFLVVGIGTSAGGLDASKKLIGALPADSGIAFILVQHMDPNHDSMLVELLAAHTSLTVRQATDGEAITPNTISVIPPGAYLSVDGDTLMVSRPSVRQGARLPFDALLNGMASALGPRAVGVVLSGTGADGAMGLKALKAAGGLAIAQEPAEAAYDGMPRSAIATGLVDLVLPAANIPAALRRHNRGEDPATLPDGREGQESSARSALPQIVELLRTKTAHDFRLYKRGTLRRRIERRMAMAEIRLKSLDEYLDHLRNDAAELERLAKDLLINVTSFFRDPAIFSQLAEDTIPDLVNATLPEHPLRIWIAGCSTGEEAYSLTMLFLEQIAAAKSRVKLQVFASDVSPEAVASAREGLYPAAIEADVSPERLANFFTREGAGYRISAQLRACVVFAVQDILSDPPFSRIDFISCRNLLIYLRPEAQAKAIALFHFALRQGGLLLLGSSETVGAADGRFDILSRPSRLYRHVGRSRPGDLHLPATLGDLRPLARPIPEQSSPRPAALAALCQRLVLENYAPAAVLINQRLDVLFSMGATDRYLKLAAGFPDHNLLSLARADVRPRLRSAITRAVQDKAQINVAGAAVARGGGSHPYSIAVHPIAQDGDDLLLVCFIDEPSPKPRPARSAAGETPRIKDLERELENARNELRSAIRDLEVSGEEQKAVNAEALSVNEEYQATNEELVASKEELQSLNEELTALNSQIQETLERQRTTSNDLQNVLYSTNVATLFLDIELKIRFFTPMTRSIFSVIPGDVGRPLADLKALAADAELLTDASTVLQTLAPSEREIEGRAGAWYTRRILPYRTQGDETEGVVITYVDVTERRLATQAVEAAKRQAEQANAAKSRFLAAASHDLRQPLQTLVLIQGLLAKTAEAERTKELVEVLSDTLGAMSGMLNALLDINQIEAGTVRVETADFPVADLLERMQDEFAYHALARHLTLRVVPCSLSVHSDPRLLEQMVRNLVSNALKYTKTGGVLLGCRRHAGGVSLQVWDTGIGIQAEDLQSIFEEYHQLDNPARERNRGLGLGLSIVHRLGDLLGHHVHVRSQPGLGSVFAIELPRAALGPAGEPTSAKPTGGAARPPPEQVGTILLVEDDPDVRELLDLALRREGHRVIAAMDGASALDLAARATTKPDLILADYNLPNGMNGLVVANRIRATCRRPIPVVILTGDISTGALREIATQNCLQLNKPVKLAVLAQTIQHLLHQARAPTETSLTGDARPQAAPAIFIVDDDQQIRANLRQLFEEEGRAVEDFEDCESFLQAYGQDREGCLLVDAYLPGMSGLELLQRMRELGRRLPAIMITGKSDVHMAVQAMKAGASDFIEKPIAFQDLLISVDRALEQSRDSTKRVAWRASATAHLDSLTSRQRQIMDLVLAGHPSKNIAADLHISRRTVENHRASIMKKTGSKSLPALARLALMAGSDDLAATRPDAAERPTASFE